MSKRKLNLKGHPLNGVRYLKNDLREDTNYLLTLCRTTHTSRMMIYSILGFIQRIIMPVLPILSHYNNRSPFKN